jgi:hypothetical protein
MSSLVRDASTAAFHLAMIVGAALLLVGAVVNAIGIRDPSKATEPGVAKGTVQPAKEGA